MMRLWRNGRGDDGIYVEGYTAETRQPWGGMRGPPTQQ